jgi:N-acyl-D-amino-acid deacylase
LQLSRSTAATFAAIKDGRILYARGYGWRDEAKTRATLPDTPMRVASIAKPITAAAVKRLMAMGLLSSDTRVLPLLGVEPSQGLPADPRWAQITVGHLLEHKGGWDVKEQGFDPMFEKDRIVRELHLLQAPGPADVVRWMLGKPLQFTPGERSAYANFGYCVLGRVIEKAARRPYIAVVRQAVFQPAGINPKGVWLGSSNPELQSPREPWYNEPLYVDVMDAHGGLVLSSPVLCQFLQAYWISGNLRKPGEKGYVYTFFGSMPGTGALVHQRPDGISFAAAFNGRHLDADLNKLTAEINQVIDEQAGGRGR